MKTITPLIPLSVLGCAAILDGVIVSNVCITTLWTDGTWYGAWGVNGEVDPDANVIDQSVYGGEWKADGTFQMAFGDAGDEQVLFCTKFVCNEGANGFQDFCKQFRVTGDQVSIF